MIQGQKEEDYHQADNLLEEIECVCVEGWFIREEHCFYTSSLMLESVVSVTLLGDLLCHS